MKLWVGVTDNDWFENGRSYYPFHGNPLHHFPPNPQDWPSKELLIRHNEHAYKV